MKNPFSAKQPDSESSQSPAKKAIEKPVQENAEPLENPVPVESKPVESKPVESKPVESKPVAVRTESKPPPTLGMDEVSCRTCRYLAFEGASRGEVSHGECRRNAPVPGANEVASWPRVTWEGWCGEWDSGVSDEDMVKMARALAEQRAEGSEVGFTKAKANESSER